MDLANILKLWNESQRSVLMAFFIQLPIVFTICFLESRTFQDYGLIYQTIIAIALTISLCWFGLIAVYTAPFLSMEMFAISTPTIIAFAAYMILKIAPPENMTPLRYRLLLLGTYISTAVYVFIKALWVAHNCKKIKPDTIDQNKRDDNKNFQQDT